MRQIYDYYLIEQFIKEYKLGEIFGNIEAYHNDFKIIKMDRGDFIQTGYDCDAYLYYYVKGKFKVYGELEDGRRKLLRYCSPPMMLGEMEFFSYGERLSGSIEAVESGLIVALNYTNLKEQLLSDVVFLRTICYSYAEKMANFGHQQATNVIKSADEKVLDYIIYSMDEKGIFKANLRVVAEELDMSYRHLHRVLNKLAEDKKIEKCQDGFRITEPY